MNDFQRLLQGERPVVLDLFAEWCGPCQAMRPILQELKSTVVATNEELAKLSVVTDDVSKASGHATVVTENAAQMSTLFAATLGGPLVKTAAFTYGVRKAFQGRRKK